MMVIMLISVIMINDNDGDRDKINPGRGLKRQGNSKQVIRILVTCYTILPSHEQRQQIQSQTTSG